MIPGCNIVTLEVIAARKRIKNQAVPKNLPAGIKVNTEGRAINPIPKTPKLATLNPKNKNPTGIVISPPKTTSTNSFKEAADNPDKTTSSSSFK